MAQKWFDAIDTYIKSIQTQVVTNDYHESIMPVHHIKLVCPSNVQQKNNVPFSSGVVTDLLGKDVVPVNGTTIKTNGIYIMSKPAQK